MVGRSMLVIEEILIATFSTPVFVRSAQDFFDLTPSGAHPWVEFLKLFALEPGWPSTRPQTE